MMQNAKDTFYMTLQRRLAIVNPARTIVLRGIVRPGVLVEENELRTVGVTVDAFRLQWTGLRVDASGPMPLVSMECSIHYATDGDADNGGMDRGRLMELMDAELAAAVSLEPHSVTKMNYASARGGVSPITMGTNVFWSDPLFGVPAAAGGRLERTAVVQVFAYQEAGEL